MALSVAQIAALRSQNAEGKLCVEIDASSPLRYCSGENPAQVGSDWYMPRWMRGSNFDMTSPLKAKTSIEIDDRDKTIETAWLSERFSGFDVSIHILLRTPPEREWITASSLTWKCETGSCRGGMTFVLNLSAASGYRQRYGLTLGNSSLFPWAPPEGTKFTFGSNVATVSGAQIENPYAALYGTSSSAYWSVIDPYGLKAYNAGLDRPYWVSQSSWDQIGQPQVVIAT
jgi:hypothetical protein